MKIVFMGTPDFAVGSLKALIKRKHTIAAVVTVADKAQGRGLKLKPSAVKLCAVENGITVLQPENLNDAAFIESLKSFQADCFVVVAFRILPREIFSIPKSGTINVHASLLPKYRGAAPINWALINGEQKTGVTTMFIDNKVDTGDILRQNAVPIDADMTAGELHDVLRDVGAALLVETIDLIERHQIKPVVQDNTRATRAPKIDNHLAQIDFNKNAVAVHNLIRGLSPYPAAFTFLKGKKVKLFKSRRYEDDESGTPGQILIKEGRLLVCCSTGAVEILELQLEGKTRLSARDFLNGYFLTKADLFQSQVQ